MSRPSLKINPTSPKMDPAMCHGHKKYSKSPQVMILETCIGCTFGWNKISTLYPRRATCLLGSCCYTCWLKPRIVGNTLIMLRFKSWVVEPSLYINSPIASYLHQLPFSKHWPQHHSTHYTKFTFFHNNFPTRAIINEKEMNTKNTTQNMFDYI